MSAQPKMKPSKVPAKPGVPSGSELVLYQTDDAQTRTILRKMPRLTQVNGQAWKD